MTAGSMKQQEACAQLEQKQGVRIRAAVAVDVLEAVATVATVAAKVGVVGV